MTVLIATTVTMATMVTVAIMASMLTIAITSLPLPDKLGKVWFFQKTFCWLTLAWFFTFSSADIRFAGRKLVWMTYTAADDQAGRTLQCKRMCDGGPKDDDKILCGSVSEAKNVHPFCQAQITSLDVENVPVTISAEYSDYTNVFLLDSAAELLEHTGLTFQVAHRCSDMAHPQDGRYPLPWIEALPSWSKCQFQQEKVHKRSRLLSTFHLRLQQDCRATHLDAQNELINGLINKRGPDCGWVQWGWWWWCWWQVGRKVVKKSKNLKKAWKICKGHRFGGTKLPDLRH